MPTTFLWVTCWVISFCLWLHGNMLRAEENKPIIAVFDLNAKGILLDAELLDRLSDYLGSTLAETGVYQVIPRNQLKQRLLELKEDSYRACYDQSCQIEIGRELAAQKSLATQVIKLGSKCGVTASLFDLKKATTDQAATVEGECSEDAIIASLKEVVGRLVAPTQGDSAKKVVHTPVMTESPIERVHIDIQTNPEGAEVFVDGKSSGFSPVRLELEQNKTHSIRLEKKGYHPVEQRISAKERERFEYSLQINEEGRKAYMTRTEWLSAELESGISSNGFIGLGTTMGLLGLKWNHFHWKLLEFGGGGWTNRLYWHVGTQAGYPMYLGVRGQHQIKFSLGLEVGVIDHADSFIDTGINAGGFILSPSIQYTFQTAGRFFIGIRARAMMMVATGYNRGSLFPMVFTVSIPFGFSSLMD